MRCDVPEMGGNMLPPYVTLVTVLVEIYLTQRVSLFECCTRKLVLVLLLAGKQKCLGHEEWVLRLPCPSVLCPRLAR